MNVRAAVDACVQTARGRRAYENAIVIANMRSGSTFLISCLGSHGDTSCYDGEILLPGSDWRESEDRAVDVLERYYGQTTLSLICAKITYVQVTPAVLQFVADNGLKIIHLTRENVIRWAFSATVNRHTEDCRYGHIREGVERPQMPRLIVAPDRFLKRARRCDRGQRRMRDRLNEMANEVLHLTYADIVGGEGQEARAIPEGTAREICGFLGLDCEPLTSRRRKSNPWPVSEVITNWDALEGAISHSKYGTFLESLR